MKTSEIRDKLLEQKTLYQASIERSNVAIDNIKQILSSITDDDVTLLGELGIDIANLKVIDFERLKSDAGYLEQCLTMQQTIIEKLHSYLEGELNV